MTRATGCRGWTTGCGCWACVQADQRVGWARDAIIHAHAQLQGDDSTSAMHTLAEARRKFAEVEPERAVHDSPGDVGLVDRALDLVDRAAFWVVGLADRARGWWPR